MIYKKPLVLRVEDLDEALRFLTKHNYPRVVDREELEKSAVAWIIGEDGERGALVWAAWYSFECSSLYVHLCTRGSLRPLKTSLPDLMTIGRFFGAREFITDPVDPRLSSILVRHFDFRMRPDGLAALPLC